MLSALSLPQQLPLLKMFIMYLRVLLLAVIIHKCLVQCQEKSKINPILLALLKDGESTNVLVSFVDDGIDQVLKSVSSTPYKDANAKAQALYDALIANSEKSQNSIITLLSTNQTNESEVEFKTFWITNEILIEDADLELVEKIAQDNSVSFIIEEPVEKLVPDYNQWVTITNLAGKNPQGTMQWNIEKVQAPQAWELMNGNKGNGTIIGILDSGVKSTHETLHHNFLGEYGWFDPNEKTSVPFDDIKHGTPCAGIAVGSKGIGVAPDAKWSACKGCSLGKCKRRHMLACGEFFACPTLTDGTKPDCSKRPHIISNSWLASEGSNYSNMVKVWRGMGIIPVFAIGNGNGCCAAKHPANLPYVIAVGDTMRNDDLAKDSCIGKTSNASIFVKPDVVAPGYQITSANSAADNGYISLSGTSMACPHVAGVLALILSNDLNMGIKQVRNILISNTDRNPSGSECSKEKSLGYPNVYYGYGRVNAYKSILSLNVSME